MADSQRLLRNLAPVALALIVLSMSASAALAQDLKPQPIDITSVRGPVRDNVFLIYAELGVYEGTPLGTPCDFY